jgi:hypothetical protein
MRFLFILFLLVAPSVFAQDTIPYLDNVPVLDGLTVMHDDILVFDKPEGQFVEVSLWCEGDCNNPHQIYVEYRKIFQNLGWMADDTMGFHKDGKRIYMELQQSSKIGQSLIITFRSKG